MVVSLYNATVYPPQQFFVTKKLTHFDEQGASHMIDVGDKPSTRRVASASCVVRMSAESLEMVRQGVVAKGNVLEIARLAGIMATKRTADLIPLCHAIAIESAELHFEFVVENSLVVRSVVSTSAKTGVEMEALTAVSVAALTIYDMLKSADRGIEVSQLRLDEKSGGRSGHWVRNQQQSHPPSKQ
jgi:cyclic pyranopterin monophosphate synthase